MEDKKIAVIGLGLIGGSLAKALRFRLGFKDIIAVDSSRASLDAALKEGVISSGYTEINNELSQCNIIFICTHVRIAVKYIEEISRIVRPGTIITDSASTKEEILNFANSLPHPVSFIGGHPMAGSEKAGYSSGSAHMFENAYYILCPGVNSSPEDIRIISDIITGIGAIPVIADSAEHDRITGTISHLPHVVAAALVNLVMESDTKDAKMQQLAAGGFRDLTRIASSNPGLWENIVLSNRHQLLDILKKYIGLLEDFKEQLNSCSGKEIFEFFKTSSEYRNSMPDTKTSLLPPLYEITVDVVDRPGSIAEIATVLSADGINIKNMNISNSREYEQGCLRITLSDQDSMKKSLELLKSKGYSAV